MTGLEICARCVIGRATDFANEYIPDAHERAAYIDDVTQNVHRLASPETFYDMDIYWTKKAQELIGTKDLYREKKRLFHEAIWSIRDQMESLLDDSDDVMLDAFRLAAAGNIIDFTCVSGIVLENAMAVIEKVKATPIDTSLYERFMQDLASAKELVYLLDNVGEGVFDMLYMKKLKEHFPQLHITIVVKSQPVSSDVTVEDALEMGLDQIGTIIGNGNDSLSAFIDPSYEPCQKALQTADVLLAKGMANFECLVGSNYNIYYLFLCKCKPMYSDVLGFTMNGLHFIADRGFDNSKYVRGNWKYQVVR